MNDPRPESEVTSPERRAFILVLGAMSVLFLAVEGRPPGQPGYVLAARLVMSALLLTAPVLLARPLGPRAVRWLVHVLCAGVVLAFATIAWGTGGTLGPYFAFVPMLPLVFTIAVPDVPSGSLLAGLCAGGVGLARVHAEGIPGHEAAFWALAFSSTTIYATAGSVFNRRQRARERRLVAERARAEEILAESERQRARSERLALVGRLAAGVAHDVARPLSEMRATLAAVERQVAGAIPDPGIAATFAALRSELDRVRRTVDDLSTAAREDRDASEDCELAVVLEEARRTAEERFGAAVAVAGDLGPGVPPVRAVRARLVGALVWTLADASGRGVRRVHVRARGAGGDVELLVEDDPAERTGPALDLPAATVQEAGLAIALAREDLVRAGCWVETCAEPGAGARLPLRFRCPAGG